MRYVLFAHGGSGNHGCEALVRSTVDIIKNHNPNAEIIVASHAVDEDKKYGIKSVDYVEYKHFKSYDPLKYIDKAARELFKTGYFRKKLISPVVNILKEDDVCLSIGGDNYSYKNVIPHDIIAVHKAAIKKGCKTILWGCSIDKENIKGKILDDLKQYDCIVCRESITYDNVINSGVDRKKVVLSADPAFLLETVKDEKYDGSYIGINASPVVIENTNTKNIVEKNYENLINYILENTSEEILLIPHVVWNNSDDRVILNKIYQKFQDCSRVTLVEDESAIKLKGIISQCKIFVGARTHSTIAAYSSNIPTLVLGYSVKARGIAKDLFGTDKNYVIPTQNLQDMNQLVEAFKWIYENSESIRKHLINVMPKYKEKSLDAGKEL